MKRMKLMKKGEGGGKKVLTGVGGGDMERVYRMRRERT